MVLKILNEKVEGQRFEVDIVFVHGLNGDLERTWTHPTSHVCWPRQWLPKTVPGARVMSYGYNADAAFGNTTADILDHAKGLLASLVDKREKYDEINRPLFFIGHSLGGIVVKQALFYARIDSRYTSIQESTLSIMFFGTPHRGSQAATYGTILDQVAHAALRKPSSKILDALQKNSEELYKLTTNFQFQLPSLHIVSFYENKPMTVGSHLIVEKDSALLLIPNEESIPVDANHSEICKFEHEDDDTYEKCYKRIVRILEKHRIVPVKENKHWLVPRGVNPLFTGRQDIRERLEKAFFEGSYQGQKRYIIIGLGGTGKSEVCLKFAADHRSRFWGVFWIDCARESTAKQAFVRIARTCGQNLDNFEDAITWLANIKHPWLLILDNADDQKIDYAGYFPPCDRGNVLFTTRNPDCKIHATRGSESLHGLEPILARELLMKASEIDKSKWQSQQKAADEIVKILGSHTLAIVQAGAVVRKSLCSLDEYPNLFNDQRARLLKSHSTQARSTYGDVYATFEVSADMLKDSGTTEASDALEILDVLAFMHFDRVPTVVFERALFQIEEIRAQKDDSIENIYYMSEKHVDFIPSCMRREQSDIGIRISVCTACDLLASFSLVTIVGGIESNSISMHPLVHAWAKDRLLQCDQQKPWMAAGTILSVSISTSLTYLPLYQRLQPHAQSLLLYRDQMLRKQTLDLDLIRIFVRLAWLFLCGADYLKALHLYEEVFETAEIESALTFPSFRRVQRDIATCEIFLNRHSSAIQKLNEVLELDKTTLEATHPDRLASEHSLAVAYMGIGQDQKAAELLEQVVEVEKTTLEATHPSRLASEHELAGAYMGIGQDQKAAELLEQVVETRKATLEATHPDRLASEHSLAVAYMGIGQPQKAAELLEQVVETRKATLEATHPHRLDSEHNLAYSYYRQGRYTEATQLIKAVIKAEAMLENGPRDDSSTKLLQDIEEAITNKKLGQIQTNGKGEQSQTTGKRKHIFHGTSKFLRHFSQRSKAKDARLDASRQ